MNRAQEASQIGDVKYSILSPEQFKVVNGEGWILMDRKSIVGTDLHKETSGEISSMPDARATFIGGMNHGRKDKFKDPADNRTPFDSQLADIGKHEHGFKWGPNDPEKINGH